MKKIVKIISAILAVVIAISAFAGCSKKVESTKVDPANFRITAYYVGSGLVNYDDIDASHFDQITDVILFGMTSFDENGNINYDENFELALANLKKAIKNDYVNVHVNLLGPGSQSESDKWEDQMNDMAARHSNAFKTGRLEDNILKMLNKYELDGVCFDYEYPLKKQYWSDFDEFLVSLHSTIGKEYILGAAIGAWNAKVYKKAINVLDRVELMSYDEWDKDGTHSTLEQAQKNVDIIEKLGYDLAKVDLGVPFYGRPTTKDGYWYSYKDWYDKLDADGFCHDAETNLDFSFNTYLDVYAKTNWAIERGLGGTMVWHYACDVPNDNKNSLFKAMDTAIIDYIEGISDTDD